MPNLTTMQRRLEKLEKQNSLDDVIVVILDASSEGRSVEQQAKAADKLHRAGKGERQGSVTVLDMAKGVA